MLSLLSKKSKTPASAASTMPAWHPNLRNYERLPDTKIVRTAFFINTVCVLVAAVMVLWLSVTAYQLRDYKKQVAVWEADIERQRGASDQAVALYRKFQADAKPVEEVQAFVASRPVLSEILLRLGVDV